MAQNLSVPLAFACLLHLANEKVGDWLPWHILSVSACFRFFFHGRPHTISYVQDHRPLNPED